MDKISPMRYLLNFVKLPPSKVAMKMPKATAVLENTPIRVSAAWLLRLRTKENSSANATENNTAAQMGAPIPQILPMAIPVKAECPSASEKKLIRPVTTMVERMPKSGAISRTARSAFFIKSHCSSSSGINSQNRYQILIRLPPLCGRFCGTHPSSALPWQSPDTAQCRRSRPHDLHTAPGSKNHVW